MRLKGPKALMRRESVRNFSLLGVNRVPSKWPGADGLHFFEGGGLDVAGVVVQDIDGSVCLPDLRGLALQLLFRGRHVQFIHGGPGLFEGVETVGAADATAGAGGGNGFVALWIGLG